MSIPSPSPFDNSFDTFYSAQAQRQSSQASQSSHFSNDQRLSNDQPLMEEPHSLSRRGSSSSLASHGRSRSASQGLHGQGSDPWRKESWPYDPTSSSTLIATAQNPVGQGAQGVPNQPGQMLPPSTSPHFSNQQINDGSWQLAMDRDQFNQFRSQPSPFSLSTGTPGTDGSSGFPTGDSYQGGFQAQQSQGWGNEFVNQDQSVDFMSELERIISNSSHPSREPSPAPYQTDFNQQNNKISPGPAFDPVFESAVSSRSTSPMPQIGQNLNQNFSPPPSGLPHRGSSPNVSSPFFNKPQSPPALIIPNQQSSPHFPPIVTTSTDGMIGQPQQSQQHGVALRQSIGGSVGLGNVSGGLLPPADPALKGLTGMDGISPIAPSADGPMIFVQPSTPISGLKDGLGHFEAALQRNAMAHAQAQQNSQQANQQTNTDFSIPNQNGQSQSMQLGQNNQSANQFSQNDNLNQAIFNHQTGQWNPAQNPWAGLRPLNTSRPRAKSDSFMNSPTGTGFTRAAVMAALGGMQNPQDGQNMNDEQLRNMIDQWRATTGMADDATTSQQAPTQTLDPRNLPGLEKTEGNVLSQSNFERQLSALQAQRDRLPGVNTNQTQVKIEPGEISPTSRTFYQQLGINPLQASQLAGTASAPFFQSTFENIPPGQYPQTAAPGGNFLSPDLGLGPRRKSFTEGLNHPAAGAGTPGYGVEFSNLAPFGSMSPGRVRGVGASPSGHRRGVKSEDWGGALGTGWGVGQGGSTADFLNSITANDGTLLPPRGRAHSRHSSASSARSASPALSISSQGSSYGSPRMDIPEGMQFQNDAVRVAKLKVTSTATEVASTSRRTNEGVYRCPVPGCGSTFTRHFNLKGHLRSHNDERPYKCLYDGCPKSIVGFARQHDCKRHMLLHEGLRPFECEGCGKKFARLDALTRHHKSEQGQECAISHPLPTNPDGSAMSESQYKAFKAAQTKLFGPPQVGRGRGRGRGGGGGGSRIKREASHSGLSTFSADDRSGDEDMGIGSGMDEYDRD